MRRLVGIVLFLAMLSGVGPAMAGEAVSLRLNWYLGGLHAPFYLGLARGYYAEEGLDLTINEGRGSGVAAQIVAARGDTFGMSDGGTLMLAAAKGQPIRAVMCVLSRPGFGVIFLADSGIRTIRDLEGRTLAVSPGDALTQLFPAVAAANGLDMDKINLVFMDPPAKPVAVMERRADALLGGVDDQYFLIKQRGFEVGAIRFADVGVSTVGMTVHAHEDTIREQPDLVRRFVRASVRAWEAARADPEAAVDAALKVKPDLDRQSTLDQLLVDLDLMFSEHSRKIGYCAPEDWERTLELMVAYRGLETDRPASSFYTNEFLPY